MTDLNQASTASVREPYDFTKATFWPFQNAKSGFKLAISYILTALVPYALLIMAMGGLGAMFDPTATATMSGGAIALMILFYLVLWAVYASYVTAFHKKNLRGFNGAAYEMRFGATELKVMGVQLVIAIIFILLYILVVFVLALLFGGLAQSGAGGGAAILAVLFGIAVFLGFLYLFARFAAATPLTAARNKFSLGESFAATKGKGWWMVLSYFVAFLIFIVVYLIIVMIAVAVIGGMGAMASGDIESMFSNMGAGTAILFVILYALFILFVTWLGQMFTGVGSYAAKVYDGGTNIDQISALYD